MTLNVLAKYYDYVSVWLKHDNYVFYLQNIASYIILYHSILKSHRVIPKIVPLYICSSYS